MKLTFYGHACFAVEVMGKSLLFDPFISPNPLASDISLESIKADYILVSHGHGDHIADAVQLAEMTGAKLISNYEIVTWLQSKGCENVHALNHGGQYKFSFGTVKMVNAVHTSALPDGSNGGNPAGFVVSSAKGNFYFAGDTALTFDMKIIPLFTSLDFAVLPIGDNFTMGIDEAVMAAEFVECKRVIGVHYNTFPPIEIDTEKARTSFNAAGLELILPEIGETVAL